MVAAANGSRLNGAPRQSEAATVPETDRLFDVSTIKRLRQMRVNPLPMLNPDSLGMWLDQFDSGMLSQATQLWDQMCRRDDTLVTVKPQLENEVASQDWGVFPVEGADEKEAARHVAVLKYFLEHLQARDAFDRNVRGGRYKLLAQMMQADSYTYAVHHLVWKPQPGVMIDVDGAEPVPALTALLEYVPLWFFENTTGELRLLRDGVGFGIDGEQLDWEGGEWMVTTGRGLMFAACICVTFKRLTFQDWTIFNERYAQNKVVGVTSAAADSPEAASMSAVIAAFNSDMELLITSYQGDASKLPIQLLGPQGTASVEVWEKFLDRQDRKMSSMYRGNDLSMMSRAGKGEKPTGASLQGEEGDAMKRGACQSVADAFHEFITRRLIEFALGRGIEPLAYLGLPDLEPEDVTALRESAGFIADRGGRVDLNDFAERAGIQLVPEADKDTEILQPAIKPEAVGANPKDKKPGKQSTANASDPDLEEFLGPYVQQYREAFADDMQPLRLAMEQVVRSPNSAVQLRNMQVLRELVGQPEFIRSIIAAPKSAGPLTELIAAAMERGFEGAEANRS